MGFGVLCLNARTRLWQHIEVRLEPLAPAHSRPYSRHCRIRIGVGMNDKGAAVTFQFGQKITRAHYLPV